jgi:copper homeostasis protein (lipoprotein)
MKHVPTAALACALLLALSACKPASDTPAAPATPPAPADATPTDTVAAPDADSLLGTFSGTLPCADCNGIETIVELKADGSYTQKDLYMGKPDANTSTDGKWTLEESGKRLRLVPGGHDDRAQLYGVTSDDQLQMLDRDGNPPKGDSQYGLKRAKLK